MKREDTKIVADLKAEAKDLRERMAARGTPITHSRALEAVAHKHGARDWNTLRAIASHSGTPRPFTVGDRVTGRYLGQAYSGRVHSFEQADETDYARITVHFDEPVDVVTFESFSSWRQRVSAVIGPDGRSLYKFSGGEPQMIVTHEPGSAHRPE